MFKKVLAAVLFIALVSSGLTGAEPIHSNFTDAEHEIIHVVKGAVEDTSWLHASSRQEMEHLMKTYYTGNLLNEISDSAWRFVSTPNDWEYAVSTGTIEVEMISTQEGTASAEILETDELSGCVYFSVVSYSLIKNSDGWKIRAKSACIP